MIDADQDVAQRSGIDRPEKTRVNHHHGSRDASHTARHHDKELAARHLREIRPDEERGLDHADENVGRRRQSTAPPTPITASSTREIAAHDHGRMRQ